jgi:tRNA nucleotidyltransferase (CCA-adding enzyme)
VWRDPFGGVAVAHRKLLRAVGEPARRFAEDYVRVLRALRFAARFDFAFEPATWAAALTAAAGLDGLSAERVREEWFKGLETARNIHRLVELWQTSGSARMWLPELSSGPGLADPSPEPRDPVVLTAALCAGSAAVLTRLRASNLEIGRARALEAGPLEPAGDDPVAVRRWMARVGEAAGDLVLLADYRTGSVPEWSRGVEEVKSRGEAVTRGQLAVTGEDLSQAGIKPGPAMGKLLGRMLELVLDDPTQNTRDTLLRKAREWS